MGKGAGMEEVGVREVAEKHKVKENSLFALAFKLNRALHSPVFFCIMSKQSDVSQKYFFFITNKINKIDQKIN
jgi:hypothetical protein